MSKFYFAALPVLLGLVGAALPLPVQAQETFTLTVDNQLSNDAYGVGVCVDE